jgi:hypothetical protein
MAMGASGSAALPAAMEAARPVPTADSMARPGGMAGAEPASAAGAKAYVIKFDRTLQPGMRLKVSVRGGRTVETRIDGKRQPTQSHQYTFAYQGVATVKAVGSRGQATWVEHKVTSLSVTREGRTQALLKPGAVFSARAKGNDAFFEVGGKPASRLLTAVLQEVVDIRNEGRVSTDDWLAPSGPRRTGDQWKPNATMLLADIKQAVPGAALWPKPTDVTGRASLLGPWRVHGMDALRLKVVVHVKNIAPKIGTMKITAGSMKLEVSGWLPQDVKAVGSGLKMRMTMLVEGQTGVDGKLQKVVTEIQQYRKVTRTLMPTGGALSGGTIGSASGQGSGGASRVDCARMCRKTFKECVEEVLLAAGKMSPRQLDKIKKIPGVIAKMQEAGYSACLRDCSKKKGVGMDARAINQCLALTSCKKYAQCVKKHIR